MKDTRSIINEAEKPIGLLLIADQSPSILRNAIWANFLNRDTPCIQGPEVFAKWLKLPLVFMEYQRVKRGYYTVGFYDLIPDPSVCSNGEITQIYMSRLEEYIRKKPEDWMWTHKRWKHKREGDQLLKDYYYQ